MSNDSVELKHWRPHTEPLHRGFGYVAAIVSSAMVHCDANVFVLGRFCNYFPLKAFVARVAINSKNK